MVSISGASRSARLSGVSSRGKDVVINRPQSQHQQRNALSDPQKLLDYGILTLPAELVLKVFECLDLESAFRLSATCKKLCGVFQTHNEALILLILAAELSPFDTLLQCIVQEGEDLNVPLGPCLRRRIYHRGKLVSEGEIPAPGEEAHILLPPVSLDQEHFRHLISAHRLVKGWEQLFPQYRFRGYASDCRELRSNEKERLRGAIYRWMSYAHHFHGDFKRPSRFLPSARSLDVHCKKFRVLSNMELIELENLWDTVISIVSCHICPSTEQVMMENDDSLSLHDAERLSFGSSESVYTRRSVAWNENAPRFSAVNNSIVETFLKLLPNDILHLATSRFLYTRDKVIREVRLSYPSILQDQQTLGHALAAVKRERCEEHWMARRNWEHLSFNSTTGGILDIVRPEIWPDDDTLRRSFDREGERALSWRTDENQEMGIRTPTQRGRLEP